jgi:hypothetical protein
MKMIQNRCCTKAETSQTKGHTHGKENATPLCFLEPKVKEKLSRKNTGALLPVVYKLERKVSVKKEHFHSEFMATPPFSNR